MDKTANPEISFECVGVLKSIVVLRVQGGCVWFVQLEEGRLGILYLSYSLAIIVNSIKSWIYGSAY